MENYSEKSSSKEHLATTEFITSDRMTEDHCDSTPLVNRNVTNVKVYKRRWYILLIFSLVAVLQGETVV